MNTDCPLPLILALALLVIIPACRPSVAPPARAAEPEYAVISTAQTLLYRTKDDTSAENLYFLLPAEYYVRVMDTSDSAWLRVQYDDLTGWVKRGEVDIVSYTPKMKYAEGQTLAIDTPDGGSAVLRAFPDRTSENLLPGGIPFETGGIKFYGPVSKEESGWYYVKYNGLYGYLSSSAVRITREIPANSGEIETPPSKSEDGDTVAGTQQPLVIFLIVLALALPALILLVYMFRPKQTRRPPIRDREERGGVPRYYDDM